MVVFDLMLKLPYYKPSEINTTVLNSFAFRIA